jgi:hypothetical protein
MVDESRYELCIAEDSKSFLLHDAHLLNVRYKVYQTFLACTTAFLISAEGESTTDDNTATT